MFYHFSQVDFGKHPDGWPDIIMHECDDESMNGRSLIAWPPIFVIG
jgi:hypothetical protein